MKVFPAPRHLRAAVLLLGAITTGTGCSTGRPSYATPPTGASSTGSRIITREQIVQLNVLDAYAVIERLGGYRLSDNSRGNVSIRQRRGQTSLYNANADRPVLVIDGAQLSDYDMLHRIRAGDIERIEFVSPGDATQRYGTNSSGAGAIVVVTRSRP